MLAEVKRLAGIVEELKEQLRIVEADRDELRMHTEFAARSLKGLQQERDELRVENKGNSERALQLRQEREEVKAQRDEAYAQMQTAQRNLGDAQLKVQRLEKDRDELHEHLQAMHACVVYARDRRGGAFDFDTWDKMVNYALRAGTVPPHALEDAQSNETAALRACSNLREKLRVAEAVRDDARAASQRYLDEKRAAQAACKLDRGELREFRSWLFHNDSSKRICPTTEAKVLDCPYCQGNACSQHSERCNCDSDDRHVGVPQGNRMQEDATEKRRLLELGKIVVKTEPSPDFIKGWKRGVLEANDKLYAATLVPDTGGSLTMSRIVELLNILLQSPPEAP